MLIVGMLSPFQNDLSNAKAKIIKFNAYKNNFRYEEILDWIYNKLALNEELFLLTNHHFVSFESYNAMLNFTKPIYWAIGGASRPQAPLRTHHKSHWNCDLSDVAPVASVANPHWTHHKQKGTTGADSDTPQVPREPCKLWFARCRSRGFRSGTTSDTQNN